MRYEVPNPVFFLNPFYSGLSSGLILLFLLLMTTSASAADVEQTSAADIRQTVKQARKLTKKGDLQEAEKLLRPIVQANPLMFDVKLDLAFVLLKQRRLLEAYDLSNKVVQGDPKNAHGYAIQGAILLSAGNFNESAAAVYKSITLDRSEALAWATYGLLNFYENKIDKSLECLHEAIFHEPFEPDFVYAYAQVAARAEKYKEAASAYQKYLEISNEPDQNRRDKIKGLINFLNYLGNQRALYVLDGKDETSIDIALVGNRPILSLKVNNYAEPLRFILDTGSNISVISDEAAEKLNIKPITRGGFASAIGGDGKFEIVYGFLRAIEIGDVRVKNVPVYIRKFHQASEKVDGYIGLSLISKFLTTLDYGNLKFSLIRKKTLNKTPGRFDLAVADNQEFSQPLRLTPSGFLSGEVQIQGIEVPLNFIVDTGASVSVVSNALANTKEFDLIAKGERMNVIGAAGTTNNVPSFLLPRVSFGKNSRESITAISLDLNIINESSGFEQSGILGGNFLKNYRLTFDFENSKVVFVPVVPK